MSGWLVGMAGAAMLAAVARCLMPPGAVRQVGSLVCAMMLLWAVFKPLGQLTGRMGTLDVSAQAWSVEQDLKQKEAHLLKSLIEQECGTYIVDKAARLGIECTAVVRCSLGQDGVWLPDSCRIDGALTPQQRRDLEHVIYEDLGIVPQRQEYAGGG